MAFNDFTLLLCPINTGGHWEIAFAFPQSKKIIYINPLGEQHSKIAKFIRGWRS
jgi:Ulp1 family protease